MAKVAIIGAGVSGLSAAYALRDKADIVLFEANDYIGGHANTVEIEEEGTVHGLDTAFIVFNAFAYPRFNAFLKEINVVSVPHVGGFSFSDRVAGVEYGSDDLKQERTVLEARYPAWLCSMVEEIRRFRTEGGNDLRRGLADMPLKQYLDRNGYSAAFRDSYIGLLATAVWSVPPDLIWEMPASTVIMFFFYHGEGGLGGGLVEWRTVKGGSASYVRRLLEVVKPEVRKNTSVAEIAEIDEHVEVRTAMGSERFDYAILATHADEALHVLTNATSGRRRQLLSRVRYNSSQVVLHTDASVMPQDARLWASWNYARVLSNGASQGYVAYYLNLIQGLHARNQYFVTLDCPLPIHPDKVIREFNYMHPIIDMPVRDMQKEIYSLNDKGRIKLCGSYFHAPDMGADLIGSHEAAFSSGMEAAKSVLSMMESQSTHWVI